MSCPYCGSRNEVEFACGGESHIERPQISCTGERWADYLFFRRNPKGITYERWRHAYGCGSWFNVARDTVSHAIIGAYLMTEPRPDFGQPSP